MGALSLLRVARRIRGLSGQPELPHLEALLESENGQPGEDYRVCAKVIPPIVFVLGVGASILASFIFKNWLLSLAGFGAAALAVGLWILFDYLDRQIGPSRSKIRKLAEKLTHRYSGLGNITGVSPALSPSVGAVLDQAALIYLKHRPTSDNKDAPFSESQTKARKAIEDAMAKMMELSQAEQAAAQEMELARGWAKPLLQEMQELDAALDQHTKTMERTGGSDALAGLREARSELTRIDSAIEELEEHQA